MVEAFVVEHQDGGQQRQKQTTKIVSDSWAELPKGRFCTPTTYLGVDIAVISWEFTVLASHYRVLAIFIMK